ncbi:hypothetical protein [Candidatus Poriferisodalis sp.]|uniref:hypothetical protein n=1 Tax=Candidatus Poriferisodalis sp. TaxID=3101277 RepID=UPI003B02582A
MLLALAAGCSAAPDGPQADASPTPAAAEVSATSSGPSSPSTSDAGSARRSASSSGEDGGSAPTGPSRTANAGGPFGDEDLWIGAGPLPTGLQRSLGAGDLPGPLLDLPHGGVGLFRVFDMCGRTEASFHDGADFSSLAYWYGYDTARRWHQGCTAGRFLAVARGAWTERAREYFAQRPAAESWVADRRTREAALRRKGGPPEFAYVMGFVDSELHGYPGPRLESAPAHLPADEVQVLPETVAVREGVLRGLVRNRSRRLWAYEVTIAAGGREFRWPLSIQPGEVVPFEIAGWAGSGDPEAIDIAVTADMSWHADPSRAFAEMSGGQLKLWVGELARRAMPDAVRDRYRHVVADTDPGSVSVGTVSWTVAPIEPPGSHRSLADDLERLAVPDLRAYGVVYDGFGRVIEVGPAAILDTPAWGPFDEMFFPDVSPTDIRALSGSEDLTTSTMSVRFDVHADVATDTRFAEGAQGTYRTRADFYERDGHEADGLVEGGFILWIGTADPARAAE